MKRRKFLNHTLAGAAVPFLPLSTFSDHLPKFLILGDSISIGYTPFVQELMKDKAHVIRPMLENGKPENCAGTTKGVANIDRWLGEKDWEVIHFNFGLHDLKREDPATGKASKNPEDPHQADLKTYRKNLEQIVGRLKQTGAQLIYATTTPVPNKQVSPFRDPKDVVRYNKAATKIMRKEGILVNDLYEFTFPQLAQIQRENNVHFFKEGSKMMAEKVVQMVASYI